MQIIVVYFLYHVYTKKAIAQIVSKKKTSEKILVKKVDKIIYTNRWGKK